MKTFISAALSILLLFPFTAQTQSIDEGGISDLVIDETITFYGRRFYEAFNSEIRKSGVTGFGEVVVDERPYTNSGSLLSVKFDHEPLIQLTVFAADRNIEQNAAFAVGEVVNKIRTRLFFEKFFPNPDLAGKDF